MIPDALKFSTEGFRVYGTGCRADSEGFRVCLRLELRVYRV